MKTWKLSSALLGAALALLIVKLPAHAVPSQGLDIKVSISASKSLHAGTTYYDFGPLAASTASVSGDALAIDNDSVILIETYTIQGANAVSQGGDNWTLAAAPGVNQFAMDAMFSSAKPDDQDATWASDALTLSAQGCTPDVFGNGTENESGANIAPTGVRNLYFRIKTPTSISDLTQHKAVITVAVQ